MQSVSRTAFAVGMMRAMHHTIDREPWVVDDSISLRLFGDALRAQLEAEPDWRQDEPGNAMRGYILVRSAFAEARMRATAAHGVRQYVALGAGFDTFAYRQPAWLGDTRIFEVDAPPTQAEKRRMLALAGIPEPANVRFAAVDFETTPLGEGLRAAGFDPARPAFFSWLGVVPYLTRDAIDAVFRFVASLPPPSEIAFTFAPPNVSEDLARRVAGLGEPFRTFFDPAEIAPMLRALGFGEVELLSPEAARAFLGERHDDLALATRMHVASATVGRLSRVASAKEAQ
jgi:methyltransferase (TIGR00027 family)